MIFKVSFLESQATTLVDLLIAIGQHLKSVVAHNQKAMKKTCHKETSPKDLISIK